ncbi:MAG: PD-(D/E)XK nuclease family protein, partial [Gaiellales bacterium]
VAFVDCCGALQEAEEVVREVALLGGNGFAWDDIAVVSAHAATDGELLLAAFERAGIPVQLQARRRAVDVPAGRALHGLLDAIIERDAIQLAAALRSPIFGIERVRVDELELKLRSSRHRGTALFEDRFLQRTMRSELRALAALGDPANGAKQATHVPAMRALLATLRPTDLGELDLLRGIAALVEGLVIAAGDADGIQLADIRDAISAFPLTVPDRSDAGTVVIASLDDLRSVAFDAVVLRGMHLAGFRAHVDEESEAPAAARDLLHLAVTRARRTLRVVRQCAGADGGHYAPSPAWQELRRLQSNAPLRVRRLGDVVIAPEEVRLSCEVAPALARAAAEQLVVTDADPHAEREVEQLRRRPRATQLIGPIATQLAEFRQLSATAVESYATCSAKWFIERWLRLADADEDLTRIIDGQLAHELLRVLAPEVLTAGLQPEQARSRTSVLVPELLPEVDPTGVLDAARIERIVEDVLTVLEAEREWQPPTLIDVERSFGSDVQDAIGPGLNIDGVEITGRVDRIDRHGNFAVLHDYKYSATPRPAKELIEQRNLQLLIYWLALQQPGVDLEPIGAIYRSLTKAGAPSGVFSEQLREIGIIGPKIRAGVLDEAQQEELLAQAHAVVTAAVDGIRSGRVEPLADPSRCPSHCRLQTICRVGEGAA